MWCHFKGGGAGGAGGEDDDVGGRLELALAGTVSFVA